MASSLDDTRAPSRPRAGRTGLLLAGDIGGTKTALAVYSPEQGPRSPLASCRFPSAKYPSLAVIVREFLTGSGLTVDDATFAVAGPVIRGSARVTNLSWDLSETGLAAELSLPSVHLMNDLEAIAERCQSGIVRSSSVSTPASRSRRRHRGSGSRHRAGRGLPYHDGTRYRAFPSEGGHADFAPRDVLEAGLLAYLKRRFDHVSVERGLFRPRPPQRLSISPRLELRSRVARDGPRACRRGVRAGADRRSRAAPRSRPAEPRRPRAASSPSSARRPGTSPSRC